MSDKKSDTWMPFYVGDYLRATNRLTAEQHGAYLLLILDQWTNGPLPNDDVVLAQIARMAPAAWRKAKPALIGYFNIKDGHLVQKRVEKERARASTITEKRSQSGKLGAETRWQKHKQNDDKPIANAMAKPLANVKQNDAPSQPPKKERTHTPSPTNSRETDVPDDVQWTGELALNYVCQAAGWWPGDNQRGAAIGTINGWLQAGCSMKLILAGIGLALKRDPSTTKSLRRFDSTITGMRRDQVGGELPHTEADVQALRTGVAKRMSASG